MTSTTERISLTERQREILVWLAKYIQANGYSPTLRELCQAFDFKSPNGAACHLGPLKRKGWIRWEEGHSRTLRIAEGVDLGL